MGARATALKFMTRNLREKYRTPGAAYSTQISLRIPVAVSEPKNVDVYLPHGLDRGFGTIMVVHGMSPHGYRDERIINLCKGLADVGFRVVCPEFPEVARLRIDPITTDHIASSIHAVCKTPELCPEGRLSIFTTSFSAGMSLMAAARPETAHLTRAVCSIGTFANLDNIFKFFLTREDVDMYGAMIVYSNFGKLIFGWWKSKLIRAFEYAALDNSHKPDVLRLEDHLKTLSRKDRELFDRVASDPGFRGSHIPRFIKRAADIIEKLSVDRNLDRLQAAVTLIHGRDDNVIPPDESRHLYQLLHARGLDVRLEVTPLMGHGDPEIGMNILGKAAKLLGAFAHFFRNAKGG